MCPKRCEKCFTSILINHQSSWLINHLNLNLVSVVLGTRKLAKEARNIWDTRKSVSSIIIPKCVTYTDFSYFLHSQEILKKMSGLRRRACHASKYPWILTTMALSGKHQSRWAKMWVQEGYANERRSPVGSPSILDSKQDKVLSLVGVTDTWMSPNKSTLIHSTLAPKWPS